MLDVCHGTKRFTKAYGTAGTPDRVFLIASISKPIVATGAMVLKDRGGFSLQDRVTRFLPEFHGDGREEVTVQNLLAHTAGLPDSIPQLKQLLEREAALNEFFAASCRVPLLFKPGTAFSYSNLGVLLLKEIIERLTGEPLKQFLKANVFDVLAMNSTSLGLGRRSVESTAQNQPRTERLNPNTFYHRDLGEPWGGIHSTAADLTRLLQYFLNPSNLPIKSDTAREMLRNHSNGLTQPWGIGWMLAYSHDAYYRVRPTFARYGLSALLLNPELGSAFGSNCSARTFGHYGVSGTIAWADPQRDISMVLLTTRFVRYSRDGVLGPVSDLVSRM